MNLTVLIKKVSCSNLTRNANERVTEKLARDVYTMRFLKKKKIALFDQQ